MKVPGTTENSTLWQIQGPSHDQGVKLHSEHSDSFIAKNFGTPMFKATHRKKQTFKAISKCEQDLQKITSAAVAPFFSASVGNKGACRDIASPQQM